MAEKLCKAGGRGVKRTDCPSTKMDGLVKGLAFADCTVLCKFLTSAMTCGDVGTVVPCVCGVAGDACACC